VTRFSVIIAARAAGEIERASAWWQANRPSARTLFVDELAAALEQITLIPLAGRPFPSAHVPNVRSWLMPETRYRLYFSVDEAGRAVQVRAVWHAVRGTGPKLR
jgi:plasmid stabilization system protein ParE